MVFKLAKQGGVVSSDWDGCYQLGQKRLQQAAAGALFWQPLHVPRLWRGVRCVQSALLCMPGGPGS